MDLFCSNWCETGQFPSVQVSLMHIYSTDLVIVIGGIVIDALCSIAAGSIKGDLIFPICYFAAASLLIHRT